MIKILYDTSFFIALVNKNDYHHASTKRWAEWININNTQLFWHDGIILEIGDGFSAHGDKDTGIEIIEDLIADRSSIRHTLTLELIQKAIIWQKKHQDKNRGLTDCISFVIMHENNISAALTSDRHFEQAGFRALLYENPPLNA